MTTLGLLILVALAANIALGVLVILAHPRRNVNQSYLLVALFVTAWQFFVWRAYVVTDEAAAVQAIRWASFFAALFPTGTHLLRQAILHSGETLGRLAWRIRGLVVLCLVAAGLCLSPFFLKGVNMPDVSDPAWHVAEPEYGVGYILFISYFIVASVGLLWGFIRDMRLAKGAARVEIGFILLGVAAAVGVGSFGSMIVPVVTGSSQSVPLSNSVSILILTSIVSYGIATRRIMDIAALIRRSVAYVLLILFLAALYLGVFMLVRWGADRFLLGAEFLPHLSAMLVVVVVMLPVKGRLNQVARQLFVGAHTVDIPKVREEAAALCESVIRLDKLLPMFTRLIVRSWNVEWMAILLLDEQGQYVPGHLTKEADPGLRLEPDDPALALVLANREPVQIDALHRRRPTFVDRRAADRLQEMGAEMMVGIFRRNQAIGSIVLGPRRDRRLFDREAQDALGQLGHLLAVAIENARLYTQIQDAKNYNDVLVDSLVNGVLAVGMDGRISVCNREALHLLGIDTDDMMGQPLTVLPEEFRKLLRDGLDGRNEVRNLEFTLLRPGDGKPIPLRVGSSCIRGHEKGIIGALLVFQDLTDLRKLEAQLRRSDRLASVGTLAAGMAHEIKNPLVSIQTFAQLLPAEFDDPDFRERFAPLVQKEVQRIDTLVSGLLEFARPIYPKMRPVRLHRVLDHTMQLCEQSMRRQGIQWDRRFEAADDRILGDFNLLVQVFLNFSLNAIEAMKSGDMLSVITANAKAGGKDMEFVRVCLVDTGRGIPEKDLPRIFDPFFTTRESGTGLGLSIAHGILQQHSASVDVESRVGKGTTFSLSFPRVKEAAS